MTFQVFITVKNPPDPTDLYFDRTLHDVARRLNLHLNNDLDLFLEFAMKLMGNDSSHQQRLLDIKRNQQKGLPEKCEEVLGLWARKGDSKWEDVIAALRDPKVGLTRLANELEKELKESEQTQNIAMQGECATICTILCSRSPKP